AFVEAQYGEHLDNWGGQYDEMNGLIFFNTKYSGLYTVTENEIEITDIADLTEEQQNMIRFMVSKGFFSVEDGVFAPNKVLSRYDFATALVGMFFALDREAVCSFDDVPKDSSYYPYVASAEQSNIAAGVSSNKFAGDRMVTKEEVVAFCTRTLIDKKGYEVAEDIENYANYTDRDSIAAWALPEVALAEQLGLIVSGGEFGPKGEITRLESVEVLYRLFMMLYEVSPAKAQFYEDTAGNDLPIVPIVVGLGAVGVGAYLYMNKKGINQKKDKK
ncbi:MAG: S-layer homology domain-containing protein, partial [Acetivibrio ethanolgignens]